MPIKPTISPAPTAPVAAPKSAPVAEKPQAAVPAERELAARLIAARDRLSRAIEDDRAAKKAALEVADRVEGAAAALREARLGILALAKEAGGSDVADNFVYLSDEQAAKVAKAGGPAALLKLIG